MAAIRCVFRQLATRGVKILLVKPVVDGVTQTKTKTNILTWMNEWCIYIVLYCVLLYTQSTLQSCGGSLLNHHQCAASTWMMMRRLPQDNGTSALTTHRLQVERRERHRANQVYALTTPATGGEERVIEPIKCMLSPHQLQVERRESHRANQVYALATPQLQVERRESHRDNQVYALTTHQLQVERRES